MEKFRTVLIVTDIYPPDSAVVGRLAHEDAKALQTQGYKVVVYTTSTEVDSLEKTEQDGVVVFKTPRSRRSDFTRFYLTLWNPAAERDFRSVLAEVKPDLVHFHNLHEYLSFRFIGIAKCVGARTVLTAHDVMLFHYGKLIEFLDPKHPECKKVWNYHVTPWEQIKRFRKRYNPLRCLLIRRCLKNLDQLCAVSSALAQALAQNGIPGAHVLHNGIDPAAWGVSPEANGAFAQKFGLAERLPIFFGGRLSDAKGGSVLLEAFELVAGQEPRAMLMLVGKKTPYVDRLLVKAREKGLADKVICTGFLSGDELRAAYHSCVVVAVPSVCFDSLPTGGLEGFACKKPVIGPCFGGFSDYALDGENAYVLNPYNTSLLANRLLELFVDETKCSRFGEKGYKKLSEDFTSKRHFEQLVELYSRLSERA